VVNVCVCDCIHQVAETLFDLCRVARSLGGGREGGELRELSQRASGLAAAMVRAGSMLTAVLLVKQDVCAAVLLVDDCHNTSPASLVGRGQGQGQSEEEGEEGGQAGESSPPGSAALMTQKQAEGFALNNRLEAIKLLERVLQVSQARVKDAALVQEICVEMWNALFPLLVPHLRKRVHRSVQIIASALADIESPLCRLRAQVHLELAKCEEQSDFVVKAHLEAKRAHDLDYGELENAPSALTGVSKTAPAGGKDKGKKGAAAAEEAVPEAPYLSRSANPGYDTDRPLDVVVAPFEETLFLRSSVYSSPEGAEDQALSNLQQIRESSSKRYKKDTLAKSAKMMFGLLGSEEEEAGLGHFRGVVEWEQARGLAGASSGSLSLSRRVSSSSAASRRPSPSRTIPLEVIGAIAQQLGEAPPEGEGEGEGGGGYTSLSKVVQKRVSVMMGMAQVGHVSQAEVYRSAMNSTGYMTRSDEAYREELSFVVEKSLLYVLSFAWRPRDVMVEQLVVGQVEAACLLSESLINRMDAMEVQEEDFIEVVPPSSLVLGEDGAPETQAQGGQSHAQGEQARKQESAFIDPRAIGIEGRLTAVPKTRKSLLSIGEGGGEGGGGGQLRE
jgi:hypothetical protein